MGFLDFLKKQPSVPAAPLSLPPALDTPPLPPAAPLPPQSDDELIKSLVATKESAPDTDDLPTAPSEKHDFLDSATEDIAPPVSPPKNASPSLPDVDDVPLPPISMQDPKFLEPKAMPKELPTQLIPPAPIIPEQHTITPEQHMMPPADITLPDFTDDDLAALDEQAQNESSRFAQTASTMKITTEVPLADAPANAIARPREEMFLSTGEHLYTDQVEPAKFISSSTYFTIIAEIKAVRRTLRQNDEVIKDAALRHEQLDQQHKRVAQESNAVQEQLMRIDRALFEE